MHVHLREPGGEHKETIASGTAAAKAGGFGAVACMPNTTPPLDTSERVRFVIGRARETALVSVYPIACITVGQRGEALTDFAALKAAGAVALSDDGYPVADEGVMRAALIKAAEAGLPIISHCEPETQIAERDMRLAGETGTSVHIAHVSLRSTVEAIARAKLRGVSVTAETCPHYFTEGASGKMNPPLAGSEDIWAVRRALSDGTIDAIATDHAPHTRAEKAALPAPNGVIGLETAVAAALTALYHTGTLGLDRLFALMRENPAKILRIPLPEGEIEIDTDKIWTLDEEKLLSKSRNTPFPGMTFKGRVFPLLQENAAIATL
jgi:dihydroorotase